VRVGDRVRIDLHGRRVGAWVIEVDPEPVVGVEVRPVAGVRGLGPPPRVVALAEWAAWRWAGPVTAFLGAASPDRIVRPGDVVPPRHRLGAGELPSPGGESPRLLDEVLGEQGGEQGATVVRIAPLLDESLLVMETVHRVGADGVVVLAPTHRHVRMVVDRLRRAGVPVAALPDEWAAAASGGRVVVGARAAAWAPVDRLRAAIVLSAHDQAYREERAPTWSAVDVMVERARRDRAPCILASPCPTVVMTEGRRVVVTSRAAERRGWPPVEVVDRRGEDPRSGLFSESMVRAVRATLGGGGRSVVVLDRTGRSRLLACAACGALADCTRCGGHCEQLEPDGPLRCARCGLERPAVCTACDSRRFRRLRIGVSRAAEELAAVVGHPVTELTAAARGGAGPGSAGPEGDRLVVGTQAALHRVGPADLVVLLDLDQHLLARRFTAAEDALALIVLAARSATGGASRGRLVVQTRLPDHPVVRAAVLARPDLVSAGEREVRLLLGLPPFGALARLSGPGAAAFADALRALVRDEAGVAAGGDVTRAGEPVPGPLRVFAEVGPGRARIEVSEPDEDGGVLVRAGTVDTLCDVLGAVPRPVDRLRLEVDPVGV
jgi:primosomal protein N' (replication factor Y)